MELHDRSEPVACDPSSHIRLDLSIWLFTADQSRAFSFVKYMDEVRATSRLLMNAFAVETSTLGFVNDSVDPAHPMVRYQC